MHELTDAHETTQSSARTGIVVVVVISFLRVVLLVAGLLVEFGVIDEASVRLLLPVRLVPLDTDEGVLITIVLFILLAATLLSIVGLLRRLEWGWTLAIATAGAMLALDLALLANGEPLYSSMLVNSVVVFYLNARDVRLAFRVGEP